METLSQGWKKLKSYPVLFNLSIIVVLLASLALLSYFAMSVGTRHHSRRTVPYFEGMTFDEAQRAAAENDIEIVINDSLYVSEYVGGAVLDQLPKGGSIVKPGRKIYVTVNSFRQQMVDVPYVAGFSLRNAKNLLVKAGLGLDIKYSPDFAQNNVLEQYVGDEKVEKGSNLKIEKGSKVLLIVGLSSKATAIFAPSVVGRSLVEAKNSLWDLGINVGEVTYDAGIKAVDKNKAKVCWQSVASGRYIPYGGKVSLQLTCDNAKLEKARKGVDVKDLEEKAKADSIAHLEHRRLVDSLSNIEAMKAQMEADSLAKILQDSLIIEQKTDSLPSTTPQE